jgi:ATP-dependent Clp protease adapter protein ClpS
VLRYAGNKRTLRQQDITNKHDTMVRVVLLDDDVTAAAVVAMVNNRM